MEFNLKVPVTEVKVSTSSTNLIFLPEEVAQWFLSNKIVRVEGKFNEIPFRLAIQSDGNGGRFLMINKTILKKLNAVAGTIINLNITPDKEPDRLDEPEELLEVLAQIPEAQNFYNSLTTGARRSVVIYIAQGKTVETRIKRSLQLAEKMAMGIAFKPGEKGKKEL